MAGLTTPLSDRTKWGLIGGIVLVVGGWGSHSWPAVLIGLAVLFFVGRTLYPGSRKALGPWQWPPDLRAVAEGMARPIDPTPKRIVPPDEKASLVAQVATTKEALASLIADKPAAWPWAVFASVLVQRRNAVQSRLRTVASGYQPRAGVPLSGRAYAQQAHRTITTILDLLKQLEQFMLSPAFKGAFGNLDNYGDADADAIVSIANRLMDYHESLLVQAETCVQTPVEAEVLDFVADAGAISLLPLIGYEQFITTMCARIGEAQELLPYGDGDTVMQLDDVTLTMDLPDDLSDRFFAHIKRFTS